MFYKRSLFPYQRREESNLKSMGYLSKIVSFCQSVHLVSAQICIVYWSKNYRMTSVDFRSLAGVLLIVTVTCQASLVNFEPGFEYQYSYNSTTELRNVNGFVMRGQVCDNQRKNRTE